MPTQEQMQMRFSVKTLLDGMVDAFCTCGYVLPSWSDVLESKYHNPGCRYLNALGAIEHLIKEKELGHVDC